MIHLKFKTCVAGDEVTCSISCSCPEAKSTEIATLSPEETATLAGFMRHLAANENVAPEHMESGLLTRLDIDRLSCLRRADLPMAMMLLMTLFNVD